MKPTAALATLAVLTLATLASASTDWATPADAPQPPSADARYIPAPCYTNTRGSDGQTHDPCYVCHRAGTPPNWVDDSDLRLAYAFGQPALTNPWTGLFEDLSSQAGWTDAQLDAAVATDNLAALRGRGVPGTPFVLDAWHDFDAQGFDHRPDGTPTGWRLLRYRPIPGTFWPTNGSVGDVLVRLPAPMRLSATGDEDRARHRANLAVLEALLTRQDVQLNGVSETDVGFDLNLDGRLASTPHATVVFVWPPRAEGPNMAWIGEGGRPLDPAQHPLAAGLVPVGTALLHGVYYLQPRADGSVRAAPRAKELRWAMKTAWRTYAQLEMGARHEAKEKAEAPDRLRAIDGNAREGMLNRGGWRFAAWADTADGTLRAQTREELVSCMGCHGGGVGAATDTLYSLPRKLPGEAGWGVDADLAFGDGPVPAEDAVPGHPDLGEYATYLVRNGAPDGLRAHPEATAAFFAPDGTPRWHALRALRDNAQPLLWPTAARARDLNRASLARFARGDVSRGRAPILQPPPTLLPWVRDGQTTGLLER